LFGRHDGRAAKKVVVLSTKVTLERKGKKKKKGKQERELSTTPFPPSYPAPANSFPNPFPNEPLTPDL
jgi:hypothetical protein